MLAAGEKASASFALDARFYTDVGGDLDGISFDREQVDVQDGDVTGSISYKSYARYRGNFSLDLPVGRFGVARDAAHWGPGIFGNLVFNQDAVPFDQVNYTFTLGSLRVASLYGDLLIGTSQAYSQENLRSRNLYAHRYELSLGKRVTAGLCEQLILFDQSRPYLFVPFFPLFIAKGFMYEEANNGNISVDLAVRVSDKGLVYGEFLVDDLESPTSFWTKNYVQNKWAMLVGAHWLANVPWGEAGAIAEFSRVEPWVYAHFNPNTAQTAHLGYPLGNPFGPNSMAVQMKPYFRFHRSGYFGLKSTWLWKGEGPGSGLNDSTPRNPTAPKDFLAGVDGPEFQLDPEAVWAQKHWSASFGGRVLGGRRFWVGARVFY
jgi:hypothetical protein